MRTPQDDCMLCENKKATKTNSHIIPSFITKSLLRDGKYNRAYRISSDKTHLETQYTQDSDKENYILCPDCETYFSVLETYCATKVHNRLWNIRFDNQFETQQNNANVSWKICKEVDTAIFRLFIYSIVWRCSISSSKTFYRYTIQKKEEDILKGCLNKCARASQSELLRDIDMLKKDIPSLPFIIFTSQSFEDKTGHLVFCKPSDENPYYLFLNEYVLALSFYMNEEQLSYHELNNTEINEPIKIGFFPFEFWSNMLANQVKNFTTKSIVNLREMGEIPYFMKKAKKYI